MSEPGPSVCVALTTCPDEGTARRIAAALVDERLAACVNIVPDLTSIYRWEGAVETAPECLLIVKTRRELLEDLRRRLAALHPYEIPELVALPVEGGSPTYLKWVVEETGSAT
ncbi:MAG TPA: divalent-cation tolerance protein CutA [Gemmatimonadota bacterium]|nr:divalent-cation tolerance protein CutA [Gemmatimonadota bacterium]